ncbi:hypothetical protein EJ03DRAFT_351640 [Teratosphaeria nubilosa]|uniref:Cell wall protein PhiA n=1 Tax=Teratosphaeria nubilosa TaxID=161662 RepID=A0A6G1L978_9PEZI|nr:hypothetical protein EJ03DRAFT_351640 [Teratosphaeria nubilosa]
MLSNLFTLSALASTALAIAIPTDDGSTGPLLPNFGDPFSLIAVGEAGSNIPNTPVIAHDNQLYIGGVQNAKCATAHSEHNFATFTLTSDRRFYLWTGSYPEQGVYTDISGFGAGVTYYYTDEPHLPENSQLIGFYIDDTTRELTFKGTAGMACPTDNEGEYVLRFTEFAYGIKGCKHVALTAYRQDDKTFCEYGHP